VGPPRRWSQWIAARLLPPVNRQSGTGIGVIAKAHIPLDRIATVLVKPLFGD
jgi:hypothetical protein